jgi:hypothetical protein
MKQMLMSIAAVMRETEIFSVVKSPILAGFTASQKSGATFRDNAASCDK